MLGDPRKAVIQLQEENSALRAVNSEQAERIAQLEAENDRLAGLVVIDKLTGLLNRRGFDRELKQALARRVRVENGSVGLLIVDVNRFKEINDTYGHPIGDEVLKEIATRIQVAVRSVDVVCRHGGDEFAVILHQSGNRVSTRLVALRIVRAVSRKPILVGDLHLSLSVSVGGRSCTRNGFSDADIFQAADQSMYAAKQTWRAETERDFMAHVQTDRLVCVTDMPLPSEGELS